MASDTLSPADVTVVSVCYNSGNIVGDMVESVPAVTPIVLVDNGNTEFPDFSSDRNISIVKLPENVGFGRGCNAGAQIANTEFLLFLNPDARLGAGAIGALLKAAQSFPRAVAFNPRISAGNGKASFKRRSYLLPRSEYLKHGWPDSDCEIPVLSGAAIFVSRHNFEAVGGFDANIFLYHEDDDIALRLRSMGPLRFVKDAQVSHAGGHSSGRSAKVAYLKAYHMARSRIYTGKKHKRPYPTLFAYLEAVRLWLSPPTWFSKRKRAKAAGFFTGVVSAGN